MYRIHTAAKKINHLSSFSDLRLLRRCNTVVENPSSSSTRRLAWISPSPAAPSDLHFRSHFLSWNRIQFLLECLSDILSRLTDGGSLAFRQCSTNQNILSPRERYGAISHAVSRCHTRFRSPFKSCFRCSIRYFSKSGAGGRVDTLCDWTNISLTLWQQHFG